MHIFTLFYLLNWYPGDLILYTATQPCLWRRMRRVNLCLVTSRFHHRYQHPHSSALGIAITHFCAAESASADHSTEYKKKQRWAYCSPHRPVSQQGQICSGFPCSYDARLTNCPVTITTTFVLNVHCEWAKATMTLARLRSTYWLRLSTGCAFIRWL